MLGAVYACDRALEALRQHKCDFGAKTGDLGDCVIALRDFHLVADIFPVDISPVFDLVRYAFEQAAIDAFPEGPTSPVPVMRASAARAIRRIRSMHVEAC